MLEASCERHNGIAGSHPLRARCDRLPALCRGTGRSAENREALARLLNRRGIGSQRINEPDRAFAHFTTDDLTTFNCTEPELESWFPGSVRARTSKRFATRCFVVCDGNSIVGYYARQQARCCMPRRPAISGATCPTWIPVVILGRLAIHTDYQGRGLGADYSRMPCCARCVSHVTWASAPCYVMPSARRPNSSIYITASSVPNEPMTPDAEPEQAGQCWRRPTRFLPRHEEEGAPIPAETPPQDILLLPEGDMQASKPGWHNDKFRIGIQAYYCTKQSL